IPLLITRATASINPMEWIHMWVIYGRGSMCSPPRPMHEDLSMPQPRNRRFHWTIPPQQGQTKSACRGMCEFPLVFHHAQRLAQDFQHMAAKLRQFIQKENAMMCQRHFAG